MTVETNYNPTKQQGNGVTTSFSFAFEVATSSDIVVYQRIADVQSIVPSTDYTVQILSNGGNVIFNTAPAQGTIIVIDRDTPQTQETPYKTSSGFPAVRLEENLDKLTLMVQELQYDVNRSPKVDETSSVDPEELVEQVERVYQSIDNVDTVADNTTNVNAVATNIAKVNTVSGSIANVNTVGNSINSVNTVSADISKVNTVSGSIANVNTTAGSIINVNKVGNDIANVNSVAGDLTNIDAVNANKTNIDAVAGNNANITAVANNETSINAVNANKTNIDAVAGNNSNITAVANNETNINAVNANKTNIDAVAGNNTDISTVAADITNINAVAADLTNIDAASGYAAEAKQWAIGDPTEPNGGSAKYWAGQATAGQVQADWTEADSSLKSYIRNKPTEGDNISLANNQISAVSDANPTQNSTNLVKSGGVYSALSAKQDVATAVNYDNITNCITEIPQDIKLELNNGTLTLKAGSKVYVPNGFESDGTTPKFDVIIIDSDKTYTTKPNNAGTSMFFLYNNLTVGALTAGGDSITPFYFSGPIAPTITLTYALWYDTANNLVKFTSNNGSTWTSGCCLPVAICSYGAATGVTSIDQVFNGFGYIGSTVFALPGVKGLIPNGRNADGTLKNTEFTIDTVKTYSTSSLGTNSYYIRCSNNYLNAFQNTVYYDEIDNYIKKDNGTKQTTMFAGVFTTSSGVITSLTTKTAFHAVDYNDVVLQSSLAETLIDTLYPVGSVYIGTTGTCPLAAIKGTWTLKSSGVVTSVNTSVPIKGNGKTFALTDGTYTGTFRRGSSTLALESGNVGTSVGSTISGGTTFTANKAIGVTTDASKSGLVGTASSTTLSVNIWERTA